MHVFEVSSMQNVQCRLTYALIYSLLQRSSELLDHKQCAAQ